MSRTDDGQDSFSFFGNPFRLIFSRKSHISAEFLTLLNEFELMLARSLTSLKPKDSSEIFSLSWMTQAVGSLSEIHTNIKGLITDLQFPLSDWYNKWWISMYLNDSINLLDICIALSSELSQLSQGQLLLQCVLHTLDSISNSQQLKKSAAASLHAFMGMLDLRSHTLEHCSCILQKFSKTLNMGKVRSSSKCDVLMRSLYGVKVETIFVCSTIIAVMSGSSKALIELHVPENLLWSKAFNELQGIVLPETRTRLLTKKASFLKELEAVEMCTRRIHNLDICIKEEKIHNHNICSNEEKLLSQCNGIDSDEQLGPLQESAGNEIREGEVMLLETLSCPDKIKVLQDYVSDLAEGANILYSRIDVLMSRVDDFFRIVLTGRDALLENLRTPPQLGETNNGAEQSLG